MKYQSIIAVFLPLLLVSACTTIPLGQFDYVELASDIPNVSEEEKELATGELEGEHCLQAMGGLDGFENLYKKLVNKTAMANPQYSGLESFLIFNDGLCLKIQGIPVKKR
jgi:hypothetical protein